MKRNGTLITAHPKICQSFEHFINTLRYKIEKAKEIKLLNSLEIAKIEPQLDIQLSSFLPKRGGSPRLTEIYSL